MPRKPANAPGTYLDLRWDYGDPEEVYVYGHVDPAAFFASVEAYLGGTVDSADFGTFPVFAGPTRQRWARFLYAGSDYDGNPTRIIHEYREAGRGRFKVTACDPDRWVRHKRCPDEAADGDPCWLREGHGGGHLGATAWRTARSPA